MKTRVLSTARLTIPLATAIAALLAVQSASAVTITWDANGATATQTDGAAAWLAPTQWWDGATNVNWTSGDSAIFGNGGIGDSVTLASPTTVASLTFNTFTGTYTLGTSGQAITLNTGMTLAATAGAVTFVSPLNASATQTWTNNATSTSSVVTVPSVSFTSASATTLNLAGTNTGANVISGVIADGSAATSVIKTGGGTSFWALTNPNNTFTGTLGSSGMAVGGGTLSYASAGGANPITVTQTSASFTLQYTGAGQTMSGAITANALTTGTFALDASGTGAINYSNTASLGSAASGLKILSLTGTNTGTNTLAGLWANNGSTAANMTKNGAGTWTSSAANTSTGSTIINDGTLTLSGARTASIGGITVGSDGKNAILNLNNASAAFTTTATFAVGASNTAGFTGTVNQSAGTVTINGGSQLIVGNGGTGLSGAQRVNGVYNLSGGTLTSVAGTAVRLGVNPFTSGTLNVSGGTLTLTGGTAAASAGLQVGRADSAANDTTNAYNQTAGTATVTRLAIGGISTAQRITATFSVTGGSFTATNLDLLGASISGASTINIGGTGDVTLPNLPTTHGAGTTTTLNLDGGTLRNTVTGTFIAGLTNAFIKAGGANFNTGLANTTISQNLLTDVVSTGGGLTKDGTNNLSLTGTNTYTGATLISGGTLTLSGTGAINASSGITVNGSGVKLLQSSSVALSPTMTLTNGTLTGSGTVNTVNVGNGTGGIVSNNNGVAGASLTTGALNFGGAATVNTASNSTSAPIVTTTLASNAAGLVTINPTAASWLSNTTYDLISYGGGSIGGAGFGQFTLGTVTGLSARQAATSLTNSGTAITLAITGDSIYWAGDGDKKWNTASTNNWKRTSNNGYDVFLVNDDVIFNDLATGAGPINVAIDPANVAVATTIFNNTTKAYVLSGAVGISSGTLTKNGTGSVTIGTPNTYTGATNINAGSIVLTGSGTLGTGSALTLAGGNLDLGAASKTVGAVSITVPAASGNTIGNGSLTGSSYAASNASGNAVIAANLLVNGAVGFTKTAAGAVTLSGANTFTGATNVRDGSVILAGGADRLLSTGSVVIGDASSTGKLVLGDATAASDQTFASLTTTGLGGSVVGGNASNSVLTLSSASNFTYAGALGGAGTNENKLALNKSGTGTLTLSGASTYAGGTTISGGIVSVTTNNTALGSSAVTFAGTGVRLVVATGLNVANNITLGSATGLAGRALIEAGTAVGTATVSGAINITASPTAGGHFSAPTANTILSVTGAITSSVQFNVRIGVVSLSGGGTGYTALTHGQGTLIVGANDGLATTANVTLGSAAASILDLNGFNQSLASVTKHSLGTSTIGNSSTTADSTLTLTGSGTYAGTIVDVISPGTRKVDLTVNGGVTTLTAANTYTGATTVTAGTLTLGAVGSILASPSLTIGAAGTVDTTAQATYSVPASQPLALGIDATSAGSSGKIAAAGLDITNAAVTYNITGTPDDPVYVLATYTGLTGAAFASAPAAPAGYTLNYSYEGNKIALVQSGGSGYAAWKTANSTAQTIGEDHDSDGVANGVEFFLLGPVNTTGFTALPPVVNTAGVLSVTYTKAAGYSGAYNTDFVVETSSTLTGAWTPAALGGGPNQVAITGNNVKYTFSTGTKNFARLRVTGP